MNKKCENHCDNKCPDKIPTMRFSAPTTQLSPKEFEKQKKCIEQVNDLLVAISSPRDPQNLSGLRLHFRKLKGMLVDVEVDCNNTKETITGLLKNAGRDHLEIEAVGKRHFILYQRVCKVERNSNNHECEYSESHVHNELEGISKYLRQDIVLNFGKVVSKDPELINIFFGIPLYLQLVNFIGCKVKINIEDSLAVVNGTLVESTKDKICIKTLEDNIEQINIRDIYSMTI